MLLYDNKFIEYPGKLQMHWLCPYLVHSITSSGLFQLQQLDGAVLPALVNGSRLKPYRSGLTMRITWGAKKMNILVQNIKASPRGEATQG